MSTVESRLRKLVESGIALSAELSLDAVLQRIVETAADLTGARYAALGVIDQTGNGLERFLTTGVDAETHAAIGDLPRGRGILGVVISEATPLRLHDIRDDPRSVGFPPNHPPMQTFLGVPILLRGVAYGNLYLTEKEGGDDFTDEDEDLATLLASQAAVAIENARLYESAMRWSRQLESLHDVVRALGEETDLEQLLELVCERLRELADARLVVIILARGDELRIAAATDESGPRVDLVGDMLDRRHSKAGRVLARGHSVRVNSILDDPEVDQEEARKLGARTGLYSPLVAHGRAIGVVALHDKRGVDARFSDADQRLTEIFAARAAVAVELSERIARDALQRIVTAQELERRRLARELHDETGQALTSVLLGLKAVEDAGDVGSMRSAAAELRELVVGTLQDVRRLAVELRPKALDDFGLVPAVERLAQSFTEQTGLAVDLETRLREGRLPGDVETALYRVVQESLTNVVKHAGAHRISILLTEREGAVAAVIEDDGVGFDPKTTREEGIGLVGMRERMTLLGGRLAVESRAGSGTTILAELPIR